MLPVLHFPDIRNYLFSVGPFFGYGPFTLRWYALAYITALVFGWLIVRRLVRRPPAVATAIQTDDFLTWATLGVILGGRLGYWLFYQPSAGLADPLWILRVWDGGMSFHGGMLGVAIAIILFCRNQRIPILGFADRISIVSPMGLGLGRVANFVNGELWGRPASPDLPWAMIFPNEHAGNVPRHPSQIYEALLEGVVLFTIMLLLARRERVRARFGLLTGVFLVGYGIARIISEFFREPDWFLGPVLGNASMGQLLSLPMLIAGGLLIWRARPRPVAADQPA